MAIRAARIEGSPHRLKLILGILSFRSWISTAEIEDEVRYRHGRRVVAVGSAISEINAAVNAQYLSDHGIQKVVCRKRPTDASVHEYRLVPVNAGEGDPLSTTREKGLGRPTSPANPPRGRRDDRPPAPPLQAELPGMPPDLTG